MNQFSRSSKLSGLFHWADAPIAIAETEPIRTPCTANAKSLRMSHAPPFLPRKPEINRHAQKNDHQSGDRISQVAGECVIKQDRSRRNEQSRNKWIADGSIRPDHVRLPPPKYKNRAGRHHIKKPLRENSQRE